MRIALIILLFGIYCPLSAQFNVAVGYGLGYTPAVETNALVADFNTVFDATYNGKPMQELHFLHGINLGARWKFDNVAFELNWENLNRTREALGETEADQLFRKTIFYTVNNYSASLESALGSLGFGIGGGFRNFKIKEEIASTGETTPFLEDTQFFIKPYFSINLLGGDKISLSIKPYLSIPFNNISLDALSEELELGPSDRNERLWMGGVTFVFYTGNQ